MAHWGPPRRAGRRARKFSPPGNAAAFQALTLAVPNSGLWLCQETSGDLVATIGSNLTANGAGTHLYQQSVSGWTRKAIGSSVDNEIVNWRLTAGNGPIPSGSNSVAWLGYFQFPSLPGVNRIFLSIASTANASRVLMTSTGILRVDSTIGTGDGTYNYVDGQVHPIALVHDTSTSTLKAYTDKEVITGAYESSPSDSNKGLGQTGSVATGVWRCLWLAAYTGATAQQDWRQYISTLGWTLA